jgi:hypothetical protein
MTNLPNHSLILHFFNVSHSAMSLLTLPTNIQLAITELIPHNDLLSLRITCQYFHGFLPDVLLNKLHKLVDMEIWLDYNSLCLLPRFSKTPQVRDEIVYLRLYNPSAYLERHGEVLNLKRSHEIGVKQEEAYAFAATDEAIYLLAECFRNLASAKKPEEIIFTTHVGDGTIIEALYLAKFPRKIVELRVDVSDLKNHVLRAYGRSPSRYAPLMRQLEI